MKKIVAFAAIALAAVSMATAKGFSPVVGVRGNVAENWGTTINDKADADTMPFVNNLDFGGGVFCNITINGDFGVQPEVNFYVNNIGKEDVFTSSLLNTTITTDTTYQYYSIDIPVLLTYRYKKFNFEVGPYVSIPVGTPVINTKSVTKSGDSSSESTGSSETKIDNGVLFGLTAGLEYEQRLGSGRLVYGARYLLDFTPAKHNTYDDDGNVTATTELFTRRALELTVGYKLAL